MKKSVFTVVAVLALFACKNNAKVSPDTSSEATAQTEKETKYPSDVIPFMDEWKILLGDGTRSEELVNYEKKDFFYVEKDDKADWVVYKTPNSGVTSRTSSNTRTELGQKKHWIPETGGKLTGTLKVQHVSTSGDARVAASYSVVVGQIHSDEGHENEPIKIFYKKFYHTKGSVFWNYEINTEGDNSKRWDYSTAIWGNDMSVVGETATSYPEEPENGIELGEEFSYEINVFKGIMYLTFSSEAHDTVKFTKNLLKSDFSKKSDIPEQIWTLYASIGRDGIERENAYAGEIQYFKQGAYNQTNGKSPEDNMVWSTGSETYGGDIAKQYANGCYAEVWFKEATVGEGTLPIEE
ncbi:polysaccharide lyase family 7 protein [Zobellia laminariae]|uniref:polysaccharide lyase family 7 protein n=1 Tax=Zobellia laminariae TaxID=248906 RepID=UPI0026F42D20|nr:polysaccharide lyase family 7 protein [Zobellia laminariae]WKX76069.1 polysaccharide lyase family 7 protein [Zobellia laminariae]